MRRAQKMPVLLLFAMGSLGAGCVAPSSDPIESVDAAGAGSDLTSSAGFVQWLHEQCPDGSVLRVTTATNAQDTACEKAREDILADPAMREHVLSIYLDQQAAPEQTEEPKMAIMSGERIGEAKQRGVISGFFCGLIVNAFLAYQCDKVKAHWSDCWAASVPPSILCAVLPLP